MTLITDGKRFYCVCSYDERTVPKSAGFRWSAGLLGERRGWYTESIETASRLIQYADDETRAVLQGAADAREQSMAASRATDADIEIPLSDECRRRGFTYDPFQKAGIKYCLEHPGTLLGDDCGLGKTIQAIGVVNMLPDTRRVLVVCPAHLKLNWRFEWGIWCLRPSEVVILDGTPELLPEAFRTWLHRDNTLRAVVINYEILRRWHDHLRTFTWDLVIMDEAHYLKSSYAIRRLECLGGKTKAEKGTEPEIILPIPSKRQLLMTGTPYVNRTIELFPLAHFLAPQEFPSRFTYGKRYCNGHQKQVNRQGKMVWDFTGASHLDELQEKCRRLFLCRRLKSEVLVDLPPVRRQVIRLEPTAEMRRCIAAETDAYEEQQEILGSLRAAVELAKASDNPEDYKAAVAALAQGATVAFNEMSKVRHATAVAKVPLVVEHLQGLLEEDKKIAVYCHHRDVEDFICEHFREMAVLHCGGISAGQKHEAVERFQNDPGVRLFVGAILSATGYTITATSHIVAAELDWVPGNMSQMEGRCVILGSMITTLDGPRKAEDVERGDYVLTHNGRYCKVVAAFRRNYSGGFVELEFRRSMENLRVTYGHPVLACREGEQPAWIPAEQITIDHYLCYPRPQRERQLPEPLNIGEFVQQPLTRRAWGSSFTLSRLRMTEWLTGEKKLDLADPRFLYLLGWYAAEGWVQSSKSGQPHTPYHTVGWALCASKEEHVAKRIAHYLEALFGVPAKISWKKNTDCIEVRAHSTVLAQLFGKMGGIGAYKKRLPEWAMSLPIEKLKIVFECYLAGDGHVTPRGVITCSTSSGLLIQQMKEIALTLGHNPSVWQVKGKEHWVLSFTPNPTRKIADHNRHMLCRVTKVTHTRADRLKVANFKIQDDESYVCDGAVVHNCHRRGQKNFVLVQHLVLDGSIDARMAVKLIEKQAVLDAGLDDPIEIAIPVMPQEPSTSGISRKQLEKEAKTISPAQIQAVHSALRTLAGVCDGARLLDGHGFSKIDARIGHSLAAASTLSAKAAALGRKLLKKYGRQLGEDVIKAMNGG